jgi:hypothetical protein
MKTNGIEVDPETGSGYDKLPFDRETRDMIRRVHSNAGNPRYEMRYNNPPIERHSLALERRSAPAPIHSQPSFYRPADEISRERLRLKLAVLQRMRA